MTAKNNYVGRLRDSKEALSSDIQAVGAVVRDAAVEQISLAKKKAVTLTRNTRDAVENFVSDSPFRALAIAAGAGVALGLLIRRR